MLAQSALAILIAASTVFGASAVAGETPLTEWKGLEGKNLYDFVSAGYQLVQVIKSEKRDEIELNYYLKKEKSLIKCFAIYLPLTKASLLGCSELVSPYPLQHN